MKSTLGTAFNVVTRPIKDAKAANLADEKLDELHDLREFQAGEHHSAVYKVGKEIGDKIADTANMATLGVSRKITNHFRDADEKIDYKALKGARKSKEQDDNATVDERAQILGSKAVMDKDYVSNASSKREVPDVDDKEQAEAEEECEG